MKLVNLSHCRPNLVRLIIANVQHFLESKKTYKNSAVGYYTAARRSKLYVRVVIIPFQLRTCASRQS